MSSHAQCVMRSDLVVLPEPGINGDLSLFRTVEPFSLKDFSSKCSVEAFVISVFSWAAWIDLQRLDTGPFQPILQMRSNKLRPVVRTYEAQVSRVSSTAV